MLLTKQFLLARTLPLFDKDLEKRCMQLLLHSLTQSHREGFWKQANLALRSLKRAKAKISCAFHARGWELPISLPAPHPVYRNLLINWYWHASHLATLGNNYAKSNWMQITCNKSMLGNLRNSATMILSLCGGHRRAGSRPQATGRRWDHETWPFNACQILSG